MLKLRVLALVSGLSFLAFGAGVAGAQDYPVGEPDEALEPEERGTEWEPPPPHAEPDRSVDVDVDVNVDTPPPPPPTHVTVLPPERDRNFTVSLGGGVSNFFDGEMTDRTSLQGAYEARVGIGMGTLIGVEAAYVGTAGDIAALGLDDDAMLISNGVEGLVRVNLGTAMLQPFIFGGGSWVRYNVVNAAFNTSDVRDRDDVFVIPVGAGVAAYLGDTNLVLDGRFTYRATFDDNLVSPTPEATDGASLNNWMATIRLGYTF